MQFYCSELAVSSEIGSSSPVVESVIVQIFSQRAKRFWIESEWLMMMMYIIQLVISFTLEMKA